MSLLGCGSHDGIFKYDTVYTRHAQVNLLEWIAEEDLQLKPANTKTMTNVTCIGKGVFGSVFLVMHSSTEKYCAVKFISKNVIFEQQILDKLQREIDIAPKLKHTFLASFLCAYDTPSCIALAFELAYGGSLLDRLFLKEKLTDKEVQFYFCEIVSALQYLHEVAGVVHRDLRTDNILIDSTGHIKICDFGMAASIEDKAYMTEPSGLGTPLNANPGDEISDSDHKKFEAEIKQYMSPELVNRDFILEGCEIKMDYFSLGCVLLELLTSESPSLDVLTRCNPSLPFFMKKPLKQLIRGLVLKNPLQRFGYAQVMASPWIADIDFERLNNRQLVPPWLPVSSKTPNVKYFQAVAEPIDPLEPVESKVDIYFRRIKLPLMRKNPFKEMAKLEKREASIKDMDENMEGGGGKPKFRQNSLKNLTIQDLRSDHNKASSADAASQIASKNGRKYSLNWNKNASSTVVPTETDDDEDDQQEGGAADRSPTGRVPLNRNHSDSALRGKDAHSAMARRRSTNPFESPAVRKNTHANQLLESKGITSAFAEEPSSPPSTTSIDNEDTDDSNRLLPPTRNRGIVGYNKKMTVDTAASSDEDSQKQQQSTAANNNNNSNSNNGYRKRNSMKLLPPTSTNLMSPSRRSSVAPSPRRASMGASPRVSIPSPRSPGTFILKSALSTAHMNNSGSEAAADYRRKSVKFGNTVDLIAQGPAPSPRQQGSDLSPLLQLSPPLVRQKSGARLISARK